MKNNNQKPKTFKEKEDRVTQILMNLESGELPVEEISCQAKEVAQIIKDMKAILKKTETELKNVFDDNSSQKALGDDL